MPWVWPFRLRDLLDRVGGADENVLPHLSLGLYAFSRTQWQGEPDDLLYLGSGYVTLRTDLCHRIGNNVACALGFHGEVAGAGSGGILLSSYCGSWQATEGFA